MRQCRHAKGNPNIFFAGGAVRWFYFCAMRQLVVLTGFLLLPALSALVVTAQAPRGPQVAGSRVDMPANAALFAGEVGDYMTPVNKAVILDPAMSLQEAATLMFEADITGAPVVDKGRLVGVLSQFDFLFKAAGQRSLDLSSPTYRADVKKILGGTVRSAMTLNPTTAAPTENIQAVAAQMIRNRFNHVPVRPPPSPPSSASPSAWAPALVRTPRPTLPPPPPPPPSQVIKSDGEVVGILRSTDVMKKVLESV